MYCRDTSLVKHTPEYKRVYCLKCRSWGCEECAVDRQKDLRGLARRGAPVLFLTLTVKAQPGDDAHGNARALARAWRLLRIRALKAFHIKHIPYFVVFEKTKKGQPHLHIFLRSKFIPHKWLSAQMDELLNSPVVGIERVKNKKKASAYVTKYISKDVAKFDGCKRYWTSQDWELKKNKYKKPEPERGVSWENFPKSAYQVLNMYAQVGYEIWMAKVGWYAWRPDQAGPPPEAFGASGRSPLG